MGDEAVGKTSLFYRYIHNKFESSYRQTLGTEILLKEVRLNGITIILQIWDVAGGDYFSRYREKFYNGAAGALIVYDTTRKKTLESIISWKNEFEKIVQDDPVYILVGNKSDLNQDLPIEVTKITGLNDTTSVELTSAKTGENVEETFKNLAQKLYAKKDK